MELPPKVTIGSSDVELASGVNHLRLQASINTVGAAALAGRPPATSVRRALRIRDAAQPRVLRYHATRLPARAHHPRPYANQFEVQWHPEAPPKIDDFNWW